MHPDYDILFKIVLIGDSGVGKSCLLVRFTDNSYFDNHVYTIGIDFKIKTLVYNGQRVKLQIWDTAGHERFRSLATSYYRGAHGIVLVYDCTRLDTFENIKSWLVEVKKYGDKDVTKLLVSNKSDLHSQRAVDYGTAEAFAKMVKMPFLEASAKDSSNVEQAFGTLVAEIMNRKYPQPGYGQIAPIINLTESTPVQSQSKCCALNGFSFLN